MKVELKGTRDHLKKALHAKRLLHPFLTQCEVADLQDLLRMPFTIPPEYGYDTAMFT